MRVPRLCPTRLLRWPQLDHLKGLRPSQDSSKNRENSLSSTSCLFPQVWRKHFSLEVGKRPIAVISTSD